MKQLISIVMTLVLAVGFTTAAFAEPAPIENNAGVVFNNGNGPIIIDPEEPDPDKPDPSNPDKPLLPGVFGRDIHFGTQTISDATKIYKSLENGSNTDSDKYVGVAVSNAQRETPWKVTVKIAGFKVGAKSTMENFSLKLTPSGGLFTNSTGPAAVRSGEVTLTAGASGANGAAVLMLKTGGTTGNYSTGRHGANWSGELKVPGGSADKGDAKAVMTWEITFAA